MMVWELHSAVQDEALAVTGNTAEIAMGGGGGGRLSLRNRTEWSLQTTPASAVMMVPWGAVSVSCL